MNLSRRGLFGLFGAAAAAKALPAPPSLPVAPPLKLGIGMGDFFPPLPVRPVRLPVLGQTFCITLRLPHQQEAKTTHPVHICGLYGYYWRDKKETKRNP